MSGTHRQIATHIPGQENSGDYAPGVPETHLTSPRPSAAQRLLILWILLSLLSTPGCREEPGGAGAGRADVAPSASPPEIVPLDRELAGDSATLTRGVHLFVDASTASAGGSGTREDPLPGLGAALERLPPLISNAITIHLAPGRYESWGGAAETKEGLTLDRPMSRSGRVSIVGSGAQFRERAPLGEVVLDWGPGGFMVLARQGHWTLESLQIGRNRESQRGGVDVVGPALLELRDVRIRTGSRQGAGIRARHGGRVRLLGEILLNEHLRFQRATPDTFCRIRAEYGGQVQFAQREGASLTLGNGNLDAGYYGVIELGSEQASVTSWSERWNTISINNSGRVDLHGTTLRVAAPDPRNTLIGLEHDGHMLAEGAHVILEAQGNTNGVVLQKGSSLYCTDLEIVGEIRRSLVAMSGSNLVVGVDGDLEEVAASSGASIIVSRLSGRLIGPVKTRSGGHVTLPEESPADDEGL